VHLFEGSCKNPLLAIEEPPNGGRLAGCRRQCEEYGQDYRQPKIDIYAFYGAAHDFVQGIRLMKAGLHKKIKTVELGDIDYVQPGPGYLTIDVKSTGICGSDLHVYHGAWEISGSQAGGHELAGIVREIGEGVVSVQPGDKVAVEAIFGCGRCVYCRRGLYNVCVDRSIFWGDGHGGFAEYATAHESSVHKIPDELSFEQGSLVEPLAVGYRALKESGATMQDKVAIVGGGSIGQLSLAVAKAVGVRETLIVVKYPKQAEIAKRYGADHIVDISNTNVQEYCNDITAGQGFDVVIETTSSQSAFNDALAVVRRRGTVVLVGVYSGPISADLGNIVGNELRVKGSMCYSYSENLNDFDTTIELIESGKVDPSQIITHRFPLTAIAEAFQTADEKSTGSVKVNVYQ